MTDAFSEAVKKYTEPGQIFEFKEVTNDKGVTYREFCNPAIPENLRKATDKLDEIKIKINDDNTSGINEKTISEIKTYDTEIIFLV